MTRRIASAAAATDRAVPIGTATKGVRTKAARCPSDAAAASRLFRRGSLVQLRAPSLIVLSLCLRLASARVYAGHMITPGRGARALGRAGSFVAGVADASSIYYTPAGLASISGLSLLFDVGVVL